MKQSFVVGAPVPVCENFYLWGMIGNDIDEVVEADDLVMQNILNMTACVAHNVVKKV